MADKNDPYLRRLNILKGQIEGIKKLICESPDDCFQILTQVKAVKKGMDKVAEKFLREKIKSCVLKKEEINEDEIDQLLSLMSK